MIIFWLDATGPVLSFVSIRETASPMFTWRSSENARFQCSYNGEDFVDCGNGIRGEWRRDNVKNGSHILVLRGIDSVGNVGQSITYSWIIGKIHYPYLCKLNLYNPLDISLSNHLKHVQAK